MKKTTNNSKMLAVILGVVFCALSAKSAYAVPTLDLTVAGSSGFINTGYFTQVDNSSTGTGVISSFVRLDNNSNVIQGYNTTANNVFDTGNTDTFNHELLLTDVPIVTIGGVNYREFLLDANQPGSASYESLDEIQIFQSSSANQSINTFNASGVLNLASSNLVYRLDSAVDNSIWIKLDASLNSGSGSGDMFAYIPNSLFTGSSQYVYLYSKFGASESSAFPNAGGFEEWAVEKAGTGPNPPVVPEPMSMLLMGSGLGLAGFLKRRKLA